jgi:hypothetical protein
LTTYGHEDTLFGYQLRINGISFQHIENPVLNSNLDDNQQFLENVAQEITHKIFNLEKLSMRYWKSKIRSLEST